MSQQNKLIITNGQTNYGVKEKNKRATKNKKH